MPGYKVHVFSGVAVPSQHLLLYFMVYNIATAYGVNFGEIYFGRLVAQIIALGRIRFAGWASLMP